MTTYRCIACKKRKARRKFGNKLEVVPKTSLKEEVEKAKLAEDMLNCSFCRKCQGVTRWKIHKKVMTQLLQGGESIDRI